MRERKRETSLNIGEKERDIFKHCNAQKDRETERARGCSSPSPSDSNSPVSCPKLLVGHYLPQLLHQGPNSGVLHPLLKHSRISGVLVDLREEERGRQRLYVCVSVCVVCMSVSVCVCVSVCEHVSVALHRPSPPTSLIASQFCGSFCALFRMRTSISDSLPKSIAPSELRAHSCLNSWEETHRKGAKEGGSRAGADSTERGPRVGGTCAGRH